MDKQVYLPDEFDEAAKDIPAGMHRMPVKRWHTLLPLLLILIFVPLLAWGGVSLIQTIGNTNQAATSQKKVSDPAVKDNSKVDQDSAKKVAEEKKKAEEEAARKAAEEKKKAEEEAARKAAEVKKDIRIEVLNAGTRSGYAGQTATKLKNEGYTTVAASRNRLPQGVNNSAVVYRDDNSKATAEKIAEFLGISDVRQSDSLTQGVMITVVVK